MAHVVIVTTKEILSKATFTSLPAQTDFAEYIAGQAFSEKAAKLWVEESYDLPTFPAKKAIEEGAATETVQKKWMEEGHWSFAVWAENESSLKGKQQTPAEFEIEAGKTISFNCFAGAPFWRIKIEVPGAEASKEVRLFARAFERGRV